MAAAVEMGEVDEIAHSNGENIKGGEVVNGDSCDFKTAEDAPMSDDSTDDDSKSPRASNSTALEDTTETLADSTETLVDSSDSSDEQKTESAATANDSQTLPNGVSEKEDDILLIDDLAGNGSVDSSSGRTTPSADSGSKPRSPLMESESDIEEILPEDPLAGTPIQQVKKNDTIVVKDTKSLVDIASLSVPSNKNEPTLVIIDTNSILSGRGPVPVPSRKEPQFPALPVALPAQGLYPANSRATITPIPPKTDSSTPVVLPTLTDDMYVVEAPSFIVPYVYEKPPVNDLKDLLKTLDKDGNFAAKKQKKEESAGESDESSTLANELRKTASTYFDSPLGKFFMNIGSSLVQEHVQNDLLKQQKRKRDRESGGNAETLKTISTLLKNLELTKENNEPFHLDMKKCEFCSYRSESSLAMALHLETPHMKNYMYRCNFCPYEVRSPHDILYHTEVQHGVRGRLDRAAAFHQCPNCPFEDNQKGKLSRHLVTCARKFKPDRNLEPPMDYEPPAKIPRAPRMKQQNLGSSAAIYQAMARSSQFQMLTKLPSPVANASGINRTRYRPALGNNVVVKSGMRAQSGMIFKQGNMSGGSVLLPSNYQMPGNQVYQSTQQSQPNLVSKNKSTQPSISITPLPRGVPPPVSSSIKPGDSNAKNSFVICEICDGYIKDLEQLRNHMQWIHKVKIHPKMIYNRPPLNCQKCQFRFFTDQGLERHLLGSHGLVTSSMQEAANRSKDSGRCPVCGRVYQWKLLNHVARDHNMTLKPAHLSYKCTVCTATFGMYKQFESHVYSAHSVVAKRAMDKKSSASTSISKNDSILKPLKINDEITIIPQPAKIGSDEASTSRQSNGNSQAHEINDDESPTPTSGREKRRKVMPSN